MKLNWGVNGTFVKHGAKHYWSETHTVQATALHPRQLTQALLIAGDPPLYLVSTYTTRALCAAASLQTPSPASPGRAHAPPC